MLEYFLLEVLLLSFFSLPEDIVSKNVEKLQKQNRSTHIDTWKPLQLSVYTVIFF